METKIRKKILWHLRNSELRPGEFDTHRDIFGKGVKEKHWVTYLTIKKVDRTKSGSNSKGTNNA